MEFKQTIQFKEIKLIIKFIRKADNEVLLHFLLGNDWLLMWSNEKTNDFCKNLEVLSSALLEIKTPHTAII